MAASRNGSAKGVPHRKGSVSPGAEEKSSNRRESQSSARAPSALKANKQASTGKKDKKPSNSRKEPGSALKIKKK